MKIINTIKRHFSQKRFLITGSNGQVGRGLASVLNTIYNKENVLLTDVSPSSQNKENHYETLDVTDKDKFTSMVQDNKITHIIHMAGILSASCERNLPLGMKVNIDGMHNALNIARDYNASIFIPSTIATMGPNLEKKPVPDDVLQEPITYYGISKVYMEKLGTYYNKKFRTDFRSLRYPSIISGYEFIAGGTASYPTELINSAINNKPYDIYLERNIMLPFMYISDCIKGTIDLIEADNSKLKRRVYNFNGLSFSAEQFLNELKKIFPQIKVDYNIDKLRNDIALTWPVSLDDTCAQNDWEWNPEIDSINKLVERLMIDIKKT